MKNRGRYTEKVLKYFFDKPDAYEQALTDSEDDLCDDESGIIRHYLSGVGYSDMMRVTIFCGRTYFEFLRKSALWLSDGEAFTTDHRAVQL
ncbi:hypothetical protein DPX16_20124 [Anabarilius grahami]|uniref:Uncharacterized protein n=1 Tax=Anabarilius grahami TaxID=495550 RepID=A0A3N0XRM2_ANAGA|nr:hypothetical protein DPX16_20124 [Anabarilius grahami]